MTDQHPKILRTEEVAEILGMKPGTVRKAAREGKLPAYRLPGSPAARLPNFPLFQG